MLFWHWQKTNCAPCHPQMGSWQKLVNRCNMYLETWDQWNLTKNWRIYPALTNVLPTLIRLALKISTFFDFRENLRNLRASERNSHKDTSFEVHNGSPSLLPTVHLWLDQGHCFQGQKKGPGSTEKGQRIVGEKCSWKVADIDTQTFTSFVVQYEQAIKINERPCLPGVKRHRNAR